MDVNKILEMLEREEKPMIPKQRGQVAKESLVKATNGDYDAINRLLEEDIALDEKAYRQQFSIPSKEGFEGVKRKDQAWVDYDLKHRKNGVSNLTKKDIKRDGLELDKWDNQVVAKECDGATPIGVNNPIPSPVMKKKANENYYEDFVDDPSRPNHSKISKIFDKGDDYFTYTEQLLKFMPDEMIGKFIKEYGYDKTEAEEAFAGESTTEKSPMKGSTDDLVKSKPIDFKSKNNGFETSVSKETGNAKALNEKQTIKAAGEELIETKKDSVFPEELDFDEEAFAELFGLNPEEVSGMYVAEEDNIPEHIEIRFKEGENDVVLQYMDDGSIIEIVNAEIVETPRFSASIEQDDQGNFLLLISSADDLDDGTSIPKSEGEGDAVDEEGKERTEEFVEEAGLDLDSEYSKTHGIKPAKNAADKIKDPTQLPVHEGVSKTRKPRARKVNK